MTPIETYQFFSASAENELVNKIDNEIKEKAQYSGSIETHPTDIPGDYLVQLAGELTLCASEKAINIYNQELWPRIRASVGKPHDLISGSYHSEIERTQAILRKLNFEPEVNEFKLGAALSSASKKEENSQDFYMETAFADISPTDWLTSLFIMRMDAGFFLSGIESLWDQSASSLIRIVLNQCGLDDWDRVLLENKSVLMKHAASLRRRLTSSSARLDSVHFNVLMDLAKADYQPGLTLVSTGKENLSDKNDIRPWQWYAVDDYFKFFFPEKMESGAIEIKYDETDLSLHVIHSGNDVHQVVFSDDSQTEVNIVWPENLQKAKCIKGFYLFDTVSRQIGIEEDDDETMLIQFVGRIPMGNVPESHSSMAPGDLISVSKSKAFSTLI